MSFEQIFEKLANIEKKLEAFEELKPMLLNNDNLCGKCVNDLLYLTRQEMKNKKSAQTTSSENNGDDGDNENEKENKNQTEKGQEPEKKVADKNIREPTELDTSSVSDETSQIDNSVLEEEEEEQTNEESDDDVEGNNSSVCVQHANHSDAKRKDLKEIVQKLANCNKSDSANTLVHVIQALNAKLYFDKARNSRRNLEQMPSFDDINRSNFSLESSTDPDDSMLSYCTTSSSDAMQNVETAEEVFAIHPEFFDDEDATPTKKRFESEESEEDFFDNIVSDTFNSDEDLDITFTVDGENNY